MPHQSSHNGVIVVLAPLPTEAWATLIRYRLKKKKKISAPMEPTKRSSTPDPGQTVIVAPKQSSTPDAAPKRSSTPDGRRSTQEIKHSRRRTSGCRSISGLAGCD
ncbi:hypothetical protein PGT21_028074 [Puccinia graminis f. sp. tritici]|nr:hypothetical protein PGT21_028074 [Puccinia graminis f. sp. tritici]KAA1127144.1 hypothetical protein PGTUg99_025563 [Puccinia graminis f. sp. tritici]